MTEPILSRFDVLTVIKDEVNEEQDDALATFVINSHIKSHPDVRKTLMAQKEDQFNPDRAEQIENTNAYLKESLLNEDRILSSTDDLIDQELLRKYIIYARRYVHPKLNEIDKDKVTQFYADIRKESSVVGGLQIAVRHIESVLRMSEAHAKMCLRDYVRSDDIDFAIEMLLESFL